MTDIRTQIIIPISQFVFVWQYHEWTTIVKLVAGLFPSVRLFSEETTGPIFTKILHDIVALVALLRHAYTRH